MSKHGRGGGQVMAGRRVAATASWSCSMFFGLSICVSLIALPGHTQAQLIEPARFHGRVTAQGLPAPVGTVIRAFIGLVECGGVRTTSAGEYVIEVMSASMEPGCGMDGATIRFDAQIEEEEGWPIQPLPTGSAIFRSGSDSELDLSQAAQPGPPIAQRPPRGECVVPGRCSEGIPLAAGCTSVVLTWHGGATVKTLAGNVSPSPALTGIWKFDAAVARFVGYAPQAAAASDLQAATFLDAVFICMSGPGLLTRPTLS